MKKKPPSYNCKTTTSLYILAPLRPAVPILPRHPNDLTKAGLACPLRLCTWNIHVFRLMTSLHATRRRLQASQVEERLRGIPFTAVHWRVTRIAGSVAACLPVPIPFLRYLGTLNCFALHS